MSVSPCLVSLSATCRSCAALLPTLCGTPYRDLVLALKNVFLTGVGGTGKTFLIRHLVHRLEEEGKEVGSSKAFSCVLARPPP
jgi:Cdc6-like AAA superfamily ATPase